MNRRTRLLYGGLLVAWAIIVIWQVVEHNRVRQAAKVALINRAKDISTSCGVVMRSQRRFGVIPTDRIESALNALIKPGELNAIALLNSAGDVVASAGLPINFDTKNFIRTGEYWSERTVALMNLVDLGTNVASQAERPGPTLIVPPPELPGPFNTNRPGPPPDDRTSRTNEASANPNPTETGDPPPPPRGWRRPHGPGGGRPPFGRPFWMSEEEYQAAIEKQGVHSFVVVLSTASMRDASGRDLWLRFIISTLAAISAVGLGLAWRNLNRSSELELRLVRSAELNTRLKEMNLAAAGLAHETKNPLNIIRGLAQMIAKQEEAPSETRQKSAGIIREADRVTAQLNEFINYSRAREVRRSVIVLHSVVSEVVRALSYDLEEKAIRLQIQDELPRIEADDQLLRQALFNLLLNAIQAVEPKGEIGVIATKQDSNKAVLEIRDNGPGVPPEHRQDVFKPYFTTNEKGTGLGLAVVQQIVLAHGWEIRCLPNEPRGAVFRITHVRLAANGGRT
jgi:signal transduction histidine kinase